MAREASRPRMRAAREAGMRPLIPKVAVMMIMRALSAIGSMTEPATVCSFHFRAR